MIKTTITPKKNNYLITIPNSYVGKELEVLIYAKDEILFEKKSKKSMADFQGIISDSTANAMHLEIQESRNSWDERLKNQI